MNDGHISGVPTVWCFSRCFSYSFGSSRKIKNLFCAFFNKHAVLQYHSNMCRNICALRQLWLPCIWSLSFIIKFLEDISPFGGATVTPVLGFWWCLPYDSTLGWIPSLVSFITCMQKNPKIHLWCGTCWPLGDHHGSWAIPIHILVNKHW